MLFKFSQMYYKKRDKLNNKLSGVNITPNTLKELNHCSVRFISHHYPVSSFP